MINPKIMLNYRFDYAIFFLHPISSRKTEDLLLTIAVRLICNMILICRMCQADLKYLNRIRSTLYSPSNFFQ